MKSTNKITPEMRDLLIEHIDCAVPYILNLRTIPKEDKTSRYWRNRLIFSCVQEGWLRFNFRGTCTMLTTSGRQTLCALLGEWADALTRANWDMRLGGFFPDGSDKITESKKLDKAG